MKRRLSDAGATLVEYGLVIALLSVVSIPAAQFLTDGTRNQVNNEAECVSRRPPPPGCQIPSVPAPQPPDEDELPPDPGTPLPPAGSAAWHGTAMKTVHSDGTWQLDRQVMIANSEGPIPNAFVRVEFQIINPSGQVPGHGTCFTDATGVCTASYLTPIPATSIQVSVDDVAVDPPIGPENLPLPETYDR